MKWHTAIGLAVALVQVACAFAPVHDQAPKTPDEDAEPPEYDESDMRWDPGLTYSLELLGAEKDGVTPNNVTFILSNRRDDIDCKHGSYGGGAGHWSRREQVLSRRGSPERALYEWHLCFRVGDRTYRGWRGFDPGDGSQIDLACRVDAREPPPDAYACKRTKLEIAPEIYGEVAYACREGEPCRRFESEPEYLAWKALPILTREEKVAATVALIRYELAQRRKSWLGREKTDYYVRVGDEDLPREAARSLSRWWGHRFHPASERRDRDGVAMGVTNFMRKPDGTMQIDYWFECGGLCGSGNTAILKKNATGRWEVVSTVEHWIS